MTNAPLYFYTWTVQHTAVVIKHENWGNKFEFISDVLSSKGLKYIIKCLLASSFNQVLWVSINKLLA